MRKIVFPAAVLLAFLALPWQLSAWEAQGLLDVLPTAAVAQTSPTGPRMQVETTELTAQAALSHTQPLVEGLSLSGTAWAMADSLPSQSPLSTPPSKIDLETRLLELKLVWEVIPGTLIWDFGKKVIHPSSGFFRTPLNVISHGALGNSANPSGSAVGAWEEGWIGTDVTLLVGGFTVSNFFSPRLAWSQEAGRALQYVSQPQNDYQDLTRIDLRIGDADVRLLGLFSTGGAGSADPDLRFTAGAGVDTNVGDSITVRAEISAASSLDRVSVSDDQLFITEAQTVRWAPRALAGLTWINKDQLSVMAEYYYNGAGFIGSDYTTLIRYSRNLRNSPGTSAPDLLDQFGFFSAGQHYGFTRVSGKIDDRLSAAGWTQVNFQDLSGLTGIVLTLGFDKWSVNGSVMGAWGGSGTEAGLSPLLWRMDLEVGVFL